MNCGSPRTAIHETALQLLQILDNRFFGTVLPLVGNECDGMGGGSGGGKERSTLDVLLSTTYSRSQLYLSRQLSQLHPELTMPMFSEISSRLQTARPAARQNLLQYLLPWLYNMELVDPNIPAIHPSNYHYPYYQSYEMGRLLAQQPACDCQLPAHCPQHGAQSGHGLLQAGHSLPRSLAACSHPRRDYA